MANFNVRIELHDVPHGHNVYNRLHALMEQRGFKRTITSKKGIEYHLLSAEYCTNGEGSVDINDVLETAKMVAAQTGQKYSVFVTEWVNAIWFNLKPV